MAVQYALLPHRKKEGGPSGSPSVIQDSALMTIFPPPGIA